MTYIQIYSLTIVAVLRSVSKAEPSTFNTASRGAQIIHITICYEEIASCRMSAVTVIQKCDGRDTPRRFSQISLPKITTVPQTDELCPPLHPNPNVQKLKLPKARPHLSGVYLFVCLTPTVEMIINLYSCHKNVVNSDFLIWALSNTRGQH